MTNTCTCKAEHWQPHADSCPQAKLTPGRLERIRYNHSSGDHYAELGQADIGLLLSEIKRQQAEIRSLDQANGGALQEIERLRAEVEAWQNTAAEFHRGMEYYRGLLDKIGETIGDEAYVADDGSVSDDVLRAKLPEIIERLLGNKAHGFEPVEP